MVGRRRLIADTKNPAARMRGGAFLDTKTEV